MESVSHPIIKPGLLEDRVYQSRIAEAATHHNTLVVLPTGLGKTAIALRVIADALHREPGRSVLFLAPTRPLVIQHGRSVAHALDIPPPVVLTGNVPPAKRAALLTRARWWWRRRRSSPTTSTAASSAWTGSPSWSSTRRTGRSATTRTSGSVG